MLDAHPDDGQRYEVIDGELFVTSAPGEGHQDVVRLLVVRFSRHFDGSDVGAVMVSPAEVWRGERFRNRVQPDVFVVRRTEGKRPAYPYHLGGLLLAVEVVSPGNPLLDYHVKRDLYLREGVGEYWIINPEARIGSRGRGQNEPGDVIGLELRWKPDGMPTEFVLNLPTFFDEAFR